MINLNLIIRGLEEKNIKSEVIFAVRLLSLTSCLTCQVFELAWSIRIEKMLRVNLQTRNSTHDWKYVGLCFQGFEYFTGHTYRAQKNVCFCQQCVNNVCSMKPVRLIISHPCLINIFSVVCVIVLVWRGKIDPNRLFLSCLLPLCQNESSYETIHMKMSSAYRFIFIQIKLIFIRKILHEHCSF